MLHSRFSGRAERRLLAVVRAQIVFTVALLLVCSTAACSQEPGAIRIPGGLAMLVVPENTQPALRLLRPGRRDSDRSIEILFPEHVTVRAEGRTDVQHPYLFRPGRVGEPPIWRRQGTSLEYERQLRDSVRLLARATLEPDGIRLHYELHNQGATAYAMAYAVTDPRLTSTFHDQRLERTYVHRSSGFDLLAADTPERLTMPLDRWLPARYLASYTWPVPAQLVDRRVDGITYYNAARAVDQPFIATISSDSTWLVASFTRETGNVWSNPELTCQHVDPMAPLPPRATAILEVKILVLPGHSLENALRTAVRQRESLNQGRLTEMK